MKSEKNVDVRNFTRRAAPVFPYEKIAHAVLPSWELSLVFVGEKRAKNLNMQLRKKSYIPNVLAYESGNHSGEIILCLSIAKKQAQSYGVSYRDFTAFLFIHGLLHLKGLPHGTTMERHERTLLKRFTGANISYGETDITYASKTHSNRH